MAHHSALSKWAAVVFLLLACGITSGQQPKELPNQITPEVVRTVKQATLLIRVNAARRRHRFG